MAAVTIEMRLRVELERRVLSRPGPLPPAMIDALDDYPALLCKHRWSVVRAADLIALLQPYAERDAGKIDAITKVAGARYALLLGLIDEPWVQTLVEDGDGRLSAWRDRHIAQPLLTIVGTTNDLERLELPRTAAEIAALLRRQVGLGPETDWMLIAIFGIEVGALARWLAGLATINEPAFVELTRRDLKTGLDRLAEPTGWVEPADRRKVRSLSNLYEFARLVETMRSMAAPGRSTAENIIVSTATPGLAAARLRRDDPGGRYLVDGWMHMSTMAAFRQYRGVPLAASFPLIGYGLAQRPPRIGIEAAVEDAATFAFYGATIRQEEIVAGATRTLFNIDGEQPVDFFCGVELMRLAAIGLREIARKSGHRGALNHANRNLIGRLSLILLRSIDPPAYNAYAARWSHSASVRAIGLSRADLDDGLSDPGLAADIGSALVVKSEQVRRLVAVTPESKFDPFCWTRRPSAGLWQSYHRVATGEIVAQQNDGEFRRQVLASVTELGTDMEQMFDSDDRVVAEAVAICAAVGPHGTPLARDPKLFTFALRQAGHNSRAAASAVTNTKLRIVPLSHRKIASLARRARNAAKSAS